MDHLRSTYETHCYSNEPNGRRATHTPNSGNERGLLDEEPYTTAAPSKGFLASRGRAGNMRRLVHIFLQARTLVHNPGAKTLLADLKIGEKPVESTLRFDG